MFILKKTLPLSIASITALTLSAASVAELSGNIGASSNYLWRGLSQTNDKAAVSGGIDYANESGIYAGTWASNVEGGNEADFYAGFGAASGDLEYTVGAIYYFYSQFDDADFAEIHADIAINGFTAGIAYTPWGQADKDTSLFVEGDLYYYLGYSVDLQDNWTLGLTLGHYEHENDGTAGDAYNHGQIDLGKSLGDYGEFTLTLSKADLDSYDDPVFAVSWAKSF